MSGGIRQRRGMCFPRTGILPAIFDGRGCPVEAQGCRVMGDSHDRNTLGPSDPSGVCSIGQGVPPGMGWGRGNSHQATGRGEKVFAPTLGVFSSPPREKLPENRSKPIRTIVHHWQTSRLVARTYIHSRQFPFHDPGIEEPGETPLWWRGSNRTRRER